MFPILFEAMNFSEGIGAALNLCFLCKAARIQRLARFFLPARIEFHPDDSQYQKRGSPAESSALQLAFSTIGLNDRQLSCSHFTRFASWMNKKGEWLILWAF
jgi:hypothetical protein